MDLKKSRVRTKVFKRKKERDEAECSAEEAQDKVERWEVIASIIENRKMGCVCASVRWDNKVTPSCLHPTFQKVTRKVCECQAGPLEQLTPFPFGSNLQPFQCVCTARSPGAAQTSSPLSCQSVLFFSPPSFQGWYTRLSSNICL